MHSELGRGEGGGEDPPLTDTRRCWVSAGTTRRRVGLGGENTTKDGEGAGRPRPGVEIEETERIGAEGLIK